MQFYVSIDNTDDLHNMQFIVQATAPNHANLKAHMVINSYHSGYEYRRITVSNKIDIHTIKQIDQCRVTASKRGVYGRVGVRVANAQCGYSMVHVVNVHDSH